MSPEMHTSPAASAPPPAASAAEKAGVARKREIVSEFAETLSTAEAVVVAENQGLAAGEMAALRDHLRESGGRARVVKNTLARRALSDSPFAPLAENLSGPLVYGAGPDPAALAKVFRNLAKDNEKFVVRGGALKKSAMSPAEVEALADLPGREQLLATLAGTMSAPAAKLVRTLNEIPSKFARALAAVRDAKAAESDGKTDGKN